MKETEKRMKAQTNVFGRIVKRYDMPLKAIDDLNNNKDFLESFSLRAINKQQFKELNISSFNVRYDQQRKITNIKIKDLKN